MRRPIAPTSCSRSPDVVFAPVESGDGGCVVGGALVAGLGAGVGPSVALAIGACFPVVAGIAAIVIPRNAPMTLPQDAGSLPG
jgi:hypothetical protein